MLIVGGFSGDVGDFYQMIAARALDLAAGMLLITGEVLLAMRTFEF
jgi:hypothetical protein